MSDVRRLLAIKANLETVMQRGLLDPHTRVFEPQELDQLKQRVVELEASNAELLEALEDCCVIAKPENPACCCPNYQPLPDGDCAEAKNGDCHIWKAIQKERGQG